MSCAHAAWRLEPRNENRHARHHAHRTAIGRSPVIDCPRHGVGFAGSFGASGRHERGPRRGGEDTALPQGGQIRPTASLLRSLRLLAPVPTPLLAILSADLLPALDSAPKDSAPNTAGSSA